MRLKAVPKQAFGFLCRGGAARLHSAHHLELLAEGPLEAEPFRLSLERTASCRRLIATLGLAPILAEVFAGLGHPLSSTIAAVISFWSGSTARSPITAPSSVANAHSTCSGLASSLRLPFSVLHVDRNVPGAIAAERELAQSFRMRIGIERFEEIVERRGTTPHRHRCRAAAGPSASGVGPSGRSPANHWHRPASPQSQCPARDQLVLTPLPTAMKFIFAGANGELAQSLVEVGAAERGVKVVALGRPDPSWTCAIGIRWRVP